MARLLILEDRVSDAEFLLQREPIRDEFLRGTPTAEAEYVAGVEAFSRDEARVQESSVVIAQTLDAGKEIVKSQKFDLVISDLLLFDPKIVNDIKKEDYFPDLPLEDRFSQITRPDGFRFIEEL